MPARPNTDIATTGWTASEGPSLYDTINEAVASDVDFISSPDAISSPLPVTLGLDTSLVAGTYVLNIRSKYRGANSQVRVRLLDSSNNAVGTSTWLDLTESYTSLSPAITTTGVATRVQFEIQGSTVAANTESAGGSIYLDGNLLYLDSEELSINGPSLPVGSLYLDNSAIYLDNNIVSLT